jgi:uncharacterized damage-inducible protein DinB
MRRPQGWTPLFLAAALLAAPALAQDKAAQKAEPAEKKAAPSGVKAEIIGQITGAQEKLMALAEAMPADKYSWRPGAGVRSVGEVFMHVAGGNYFLGTFIGVKPPAGLDVRNLEKDGGDKAKAIDGMKKSFDHILDALAAIPESDLDKPAKIFGRDSTYREAMLIIATHAHEHLGQSIAYARMNAVVPPWSAKE